MRTQEFILEFNVREMPKDIMDVNIWHRRSTFLLRHDLETVLSVDKYIWGRIHHVEDAMDYYSKFDLQKFESFLSTLEGIQWKPCWLIAISAVVKVDLTEEDEYEELDRDCIYPASPSAPEKDWTLLGYDIMDNTIDYSGLSNCGYMEDEGVEDLREKWKMHINKFHLLTNLDSAFEFRNLTNRRVVEHAPFTVCGIYLIKSFE